ncbi:FAD-dependent oxidoreductase, partial [Streptomyces sp. NPDC059202]
VTTVIAGGGVAGLALALALGARGHRVRVLEPGGAPPDGPAAKAAGLWHRPGVPQARHDHILNALGVRALRRHAPAVLTAALDEGARLLDLTRAAPPPATALPGDEDFVTLVVRRPVLDVVLHRAARTTPGVTIRHGVRVTGLTLTPGGPAGRRVRGVVTDSGERIAADVVVDATGIRSASRGWLAAAGLPVPDDLAVPGSLRAYGRFYRLRDPHGPLPGPLNRGNAAGGVWDHYSAVLHPADNGTFAVTFGALPGDRALAALATPGGFTAAGRLSPFLAPWLADGVAEPLGPVRVTGMPPNLWRGDAPGGPHRVGGLLRTGDAAGVTDPMFGRGMSLALAHAFALAGVIDGHPAGGPELDEAAAEVTGRLLRPWYERGAHDSRARVERWRAAAGLPPEPAASPGDGSVPPPGPGLPPEAAAAAGTDPVVWRGVTRVQTSLSTPAEVLAREGFRARLRAAARTAGPAPDGPRPPTRDELRRALAARRPPEGGTE